jgi:hypothetical protein
MREVPVCIIISIDDQWQRIEHVGLYLPVVDTKRAYLPACADRAATRATERLNILRSIGDIELMSGDGICNWLAVRGQLQ